MLVLWFPGSRTDLAFLTTSVWPVCEQKRLFYICWHGWLISVLVTQQPYERDSVWPHTPTLWDSFWQSNSSCIFLFGVLVIILSVCSSVNRWRSKQIRSSSRGQWSLDLRVLLDSLVGFHSLELHKLKDNQWFVLTGWILMIMVFPSSSVRLHQ